MYVRSLTTITSQLLRRNLGYTLYTSGLNSWLWTIWGKNIHTHTVS
uniref:Uncharacterized protein n=1 Tax=Anguilla anguilla TaxID=7936 RepID=A0A0E9QUC3_ANGAN